MPYTKQPWNQYDNNKSIEQNIQNNAIVTPGKMKHIEDGIVLVQTEMNNENEEFVQEVNGEISKVTAQLAETETELSKKPNKNETGWATLNSFDEPTRAVIQGLEPGEINAVLGERNVQPINTTFFEVGKNKFDKTTANAGRKLTSNGGNMLSPLHSYSEPMKVLPNLPYQFTNVVDGVWYTPDNVFIEHFGGFQSYKISPENVGSLRISALTEKLDTVMVEQSYLQTEYEPFKYVIPAENVNKHTIEPEDIPSHSIDFSKTDFITPGKNLHDPSKAKVGTYVSDVYGEIQVNDSYSSMVFEEVEPGKSYYISGAAMDGFRYVWFGEGKKYIRGGFQTQPLIAPTDARTLIYSYFKYDNDKIMLENNDKVTAFEPFGLTIPKLRIGNDETPVNIPPKSIDYTKTDFVTTGKNMHDPSKEIIGKYVYEKTGNFSPNPVYTGMEIKSITPGEPYYISGVRVIRHAWLDAGGGFISGGLDSPRPYIAPDGAEILRYSYLETSTETPMLEINDKETVFEPFGIVIPKLLQTLSKDEVLVFLPKEINIAVGRTIEIYNRQAVWTGNMDNYHVQWVSSVGRSFGRKWSCKAESGMIGTYSLRLNVYDNDMKPVATTTTTVKIVSNVMNTNVGLLNIGDSLSNSKPWYQELKVLSLNKISFVGTRTGGMTSGEGHEGRSGASSGWYLNDSTYTFENLFDGSGPDGTKNPFWNPTTSKFDLNYYKSTYSKTFNAVQLFLGTNGIAIDPTINAGNIKKIVDGIKESDSTIPIFVVNTLFRGGQDGMGKQLSSDGYSAGSGVWKLEEDRKVFNLMVALSDALKDYSNVHFVPIALTHDSENNFKDTTKQIPVNPRSTITKIEDSEATHPQTPGYLQMADIMFSTIAAKLS